MAARVQWKWWFAAILLLLPLTTGWNLFAASFYPSLTIKVGRALHGVTQQVTPEFSFAAIRDGRFQRAVATRVGEAVPLRPYLIRLNNQIAFSLFGELNVPDLMIGANGQLIEKGYLDEYCARRGDLADRLATRMIPLLQTIQTYYKSRGGMFLYVITPSKAAHLPEYFVDRVDCPSTEAERRNLVPAYAERLRQAGIAVFDAATFIHGLKGKYPVDLFPRGGIHWNSLAVARAVQEMVKAINAQAGAESLPMFDFESSLSDRPRGSDRDLADLINVIAPPLDYPTPRLTYTTPTSCGTHPVRFEAAVVGGSFMYDPTELLTRAACLSKLNLYFYLKVGRFNGAPQRQVQAGLSNQDLLPLRDVRLLVLEENERLLGSSSYVEVLNDLLSGN